jgi:hypothetical protein
LFENGQAVKTGLGSTSVTVSLGSSVFSVRAAVAPPKPPPTTTTRPLACAEAIDGAARLAAGGELQEGAPCRHGLLRLGGEPGRDRVDLLIVEAFGDATHDEDGQAPLRYSRMNWTMSEALRPAMRGNDRIGNALGRVAARARAGAGRALRPLPGPGWPAGECWPAPGAADDAS